MHSRQIFIFIVLFLFQVHGFAATAEKYAEKTNSLEQDSNKLFADFLTQMNRKKTLKEKLSELKKYEEDFKKLRARDEKRHDEELEINLDILADSLAQIPRDNFEKKDCDKIRHKILFQYEPTASKVPEQASLKKTFSVVDSLCK